MEMRMIYQYQNHSSSSICSGRKRKLSLTTVSPTSSTLCSTPSLSSTTIKEYCYSNNNNIISKQEEADDDTSTNMIQNIIQQQQQQQQLVPVVSPLCTNERKRVRFALSEPETIPSLSTDQLNNDGFVQCWYTVSPNFPLFLFVCV
jgi:hypothetical protein